MGMTAFCFISAAVGIMAHLFDWHWYFEWMDSASEGNGEDTKSGRIINLIFIIAMLIIGFITLFD